MNAFRFAKRCRSLLRVGVLSPVATPARAQAPQAPRLPTPTSSRAASTS